MKVPLLLTFGLCLSLTIPAIAQRPSDHQQDQKQTQQKSRDRERTHQQTQPKAQQQERQRTQQQTQPQVRQQERQRTQQQTQPQVRQQQRDRTYQQPQVRQQQRPRTQQQMRSQNRERFIPRNTPPRQNARNFQRNYYREPNGRIDRRPMYRNGIWYGRAAPNDARFRLRQPWARGHFYRYGPNYYHRIIRFNRANYWFWLASGYYFQIAYWDWPYCSDWCWDCGDEFMIYLDPDHPGWYLVLNVQTGVYVHATFMGR